MVVSSVGIKRVVCKPIRKEKAIVGNEHIHKADNSRCVIKQSQFYPNFNQGYAHRHAAVCYNQDGSLVTFFPEILTKEDCILCIGKFKRQKRCKLTSKPVVYRKVDKVIYLLILTSMSNIKNLAQILFFAIS